MKPPRVFYRTADIHWSGLRIIVCLLATRPRPLTIRLRVWPSSRDPLTLAA